MRPYLRGADAAWSGLDPSDAKETNFDPADQARFGLRPGDVLLNDGSGSASEVGRPAIWRGEVAGCCFQNTPPRVRPEACTSEFLCDYFLHAARSGSFAPETPGGPSDPGCPRRSRAGRRVRDGERPASTTRSGTTPERARGCRAAR